MMDKLNAQLALGVVSIVVMLALIFVIQDEPDYNFRKKYQGELLYGLIVACTSVSLAVIFTLATWFNSGESACGEWHILSVLAVCWIVAAGVLTFGPFSSTPTNGYYASWAAMLISVNAAAYSFKRRNVVCV